MKPLESIEIDCRAELLSSFLWNDTNPVFQGAIVVPVFGPVVSREIEMEQEIRNDTRALCPVLEHVISVSERHCQVDNAS